MKIRRVRTELFHADGWGDRHTDRETNNDIPSHSSLFSEGV